MTTQTTKQLTLVYGEDERMAYVMDGDEQFAVMSVVDAVEAATQNDDDVEPDYECLVELMTDMFGEAIAAAGYDYDARELRRAVSVYVTPGGWLETPTFSVSRLPSARRTIVLVYNPDHDIVGAVEASDDSAEAVEREIQELSSDFETEIVITETLADFEQSLYDSEEID